ncbi:MAG: type I glyceraldehyde-3-phosphate dehydrogenase, partial [Acidobacteriota bacterium]
MKATVGINGFGRIGRSVFRILSGRREYRVAAVNDIGDPLTLAYLLKYDTIRRVFEKEVVPRGDHLIVGGTETRLLSERDPARIPWGKMGVEVVVESTGRFRRREENARHLEAGARKVILTVPAKDKIDATIVLGVNDEALRPEHQIVSNASCTTNCLAPVAKVLDRSFGIERGLMNTIHAYTNDQRLADVPHKDLRRSRAANENVIPTTTGAARAVGEVLPGLKGRLDGLAMRVPVPDGSVVDLTVLLRRPASVDEVNEAIRRAAEGPLRGILEYSSAPLVSSDVIGNAHSSIFDSLATQRVGPNALKVIAWYDNEWGYAC